jgi:hypothetical protein
MDPAVAVNVPVVEPAPTAAVAGTVSSGLLLLRETEAPPAPAALDKVTVHVVEAPDPRLVGVQLNRLTTVGATSEIPADCELPFSEAVTETLWSEAMVPAVAVNVVLVDAAATVADAGTVSRPVVLLNETETPPVPAALDSVTVHVELAPELKLVGLQESWLTTVGATSEIPTDCELPFSEALTDAV